MSLQLAFQKHQSGILTLGLLTLGLLQIIGEMRNIENIWIGLRNVLLMDFESDKASKLIAFGVTPNSSTHLVLFSDM